MSSVAKEKLEDIRGAKVTPGEHIALELIRQVRQNRLIIYMLSVYADDSSDAKRDRIFAIAGIMGTQEQWDTIEIDWRTCTKGKIFHATDCESGHGDYKGISEEDRHNEYKELTKILSKSMLSGFGAIVNIPDYKSCTLHDLKNAPYFHCFLSVVLHFVKWTRLIIPQQTVKFVFDINPEIEYSAGYLYDYLIKRPKYKEYTQYMHKQLGFSTSEEVGIQVADLFSHEAMKYCDNLYFAEKKRYTRKSISELFITDRFKLRYYEKNYFENLENRHKNALRIYRERYSQWLKKHKRQDNAVNRLTFNMHLELINDFMS